MDILSFHGDNEFLSNFYMARVKYKELSYTNNEAAFQAQKDLSHSWDFTMLNPNEAKKLGRKVDLRADWDNVREVIMYDICKAKFEQHPELKAKLLATDGLLEEGNTWGDKVWGTVNGVGENKLGLILMRLREEFR